MRTSLLLLMLGGAAGCSSPSATQPAASPAAKAPATAEATSAAEAAPPDSVQQAVQAYVRDHAATFPGYEPVRWSQPVAYTKVREAAIKGVVAMKAFDDALVPRNQALANYKAAMAKHEAPARVAEMKARYGKANKYNDSLLVIANSFIGVRDSARLGTEVTHIYRTKKPNGMVLDSTTFVVYRSGRVEQL